MKYTLNSLRRISFILRSILFVFVLRTTLLVPYGSCHGVSKELRVYALIFPHFSKSPPFTAEPRSAVQCSGAAANRQPANNPPSCRFSVYKPALRNYSNCATTPPRTARSLTAWRAAAALRESVPAIAIKSFPRSGTQKD